MGVIGIHRPVRLCNWLCRQGYSVKVFAGRHQWAPGGLNPDPSNLSLLDPRIEVSRIPSLHPIQRIIDARDRRRAGSGVAKAGDGPRATGAGSPRGGAPRSSFSRILDAVQSLGSKPDRFSGWLLTALPPLLLELMSGRARGIFVTGPPWTPLLVGALAARITGTPLFLDYRDPWNFNPYHRGESSRIMLALEKWILKGARTVFTNTGTMGECYRSAFPGMASKIIPVYNGIDAKTREDIAKLAAEHGGRSGERFTVSHIGTVYRNRMPAALAALLADVAARWTGGKEIRFRFLGTLEDKSVLESAFTARGCRHLLELAGQVPAREARLEQVRADVLLLLQSGTALQLPAKIFEYAVAEKPILCFAEPGSETANLVEKYGLGGVLSGTESSDVVLASLMALRDRAWDPDMRAGFFRDFDGDSQSRAMAEAIVGE
ncbi:MAG TPA: glycosyltransferase [Fibrobacteria bacterium]|nr:glycosyltransferase [Fibrobacteria bacterium]